MQHIAGTSTWASTVVRALKCTTTKTLSRARSCYHGLTVCSTSFVAFSAGYNGDRESNYSVSTTGRVVCLVDLPGFGLMLRKDTASWRTFPAGEELTRVQSQSSLITGEPYLLVNIDT